MIQSRSPWSWEKQWWQWWDSRVWVCGRCCDFDLYHVEANLTFLLLVTLILALPSRWRLTNWKSKRPVRHVALANVVDFPSESYRQNDTISRLEVVPSGFFLFFILIPVTFPYKRTVSGVGLHEKTSVVSHVPMGNSSSALFQTRCGDFDLDLDFDLDRDRDLDLDRRRETECDDGISSIYVYIFDRRNVDFARNGVILEQLFFDFIFIL